MTRTELETRLIADTMDTDIDSVEEYLSALGDTRECDEGIADGIDDEDCEDEYVMYRSYDLNANGKRFHIIFSYGNNTRDIADIVVREED